MSEGKRSNRDHVQAERGRWGTTPEVVKKAVRSNDSDSVQANRTAP